jgi:hypothetical protein
MGWYYGSPSKSAVIEELTVSPEGRFRTLHKAIKGNVLWAVHEVPASDWIDGAGRVEAAGPPARFIGCYLLGAHNGDWGYKPMDESMGPVEISCPLKYLDMVPDPGGYATEWRAKVRAAAAKRALVTGLKVGDTIHLRAGCTPATLVVTRVKPLRATAGYVDYRVPRRLIERVDHAALTETVTVL